MGSVKNTSFVNRNHESSGEMEIREFTRGGWRKFSKYRNGETNYGKSVRIISIVTSDHTLTRRNRQYDVALSRVMKYDS
jgi:hypothetical protein